MPLYEYTCSTCSADFTLLQSVHTAPGETLCPECGKTNVVRRMSTFAPSVSGTSPAPPMGCGNPMGGCGGGMCGMG